MLVYDKLKKFADMEFDISKHLLDIVYSQTICWFALFFAPLISVVTVLKMFLMFYLRLFFVKKVSVSDSILSCVDIHITDKI